MVDFKIIGKRIRNRRKDLLITQENLAARLNVTTSYISLIERGKSKSSLNHLDEFAALLKTDLEYLITGASTNSSHYLDQEFQDKLTNLSASKKELLRKILITLDEF